MSGVEDLEERVVERGIVRGAGEVDGGAHGIERRALGAADDGEEGDSLGDRSVAEDRRGELAGGKGHAVEEGEVPGGVIVGDQEVGESAPASVAHGDQGARGWRLQRTK